MTWKCKETYCKFETTDVTEMIIHYLIRETNENQKDDLLTTIIEMLY